MPAVARARRARASSVVVLEPGRAFGTGLHETTSLVAQVLAELRLEGATVLDVGCGSGILSLVALRLGAARAVAVDVDPDAVAVTRENAARNERATIASTSDETPVDDLPGLSPWSSRTSSRDRSSISRPRSWRASLRAGCLVLSGILAPDVAPSQLEDIRHAYRVAARGGRERARASGSP